MDKINYKRLSQFQKLLLLLFDSRKFDYSTYHFLYAAGCPFAQRPFSVVTFIWHISLPLSRPLAALFPFCFLFFSLLHFTFSHVIHFVLGFPKYIIVCPCTRLSECTNTDTK